MLPHFVKKIPLITVLETTKNSYEKIFLCHLGHLYLIHTFDFFKIKTLFLCLDSDQINMSAAMFQAEFFLLNPTCCLKFDENYLLKCLDNNNNNNNKDAKNTR